MKPIVEFLSTPDNPSAAAFAELGPGKLSRSYAEVLDVVQRLQRNGAADVSLREIQAAFERLHGRRIELSSVSARVSGLVSAGRLVRRVDIRACDVTGRMVRPVRVPERPARLF